MTSKRMIVIDILLPGALTVLAFVMVRVILVSSAPRWMVILSLVGLAMVAIGSAIGRWTRRPDHLRAMQSHLILEIANESLSHMRRGLTRETAEAVCRIVRAETAVAAVAITDTERILGFAGLGEDHHAIGEPILTCATKEALKHNEHRILGSREEIGCSNETCPLCAAIVVPLENRGEPVGTLKFYYTTSRLLNETQITMAEGLAKLLSTLLELSELERQTELATRMELKALQAQINPHFLFNTINTIAMLIRTDPDRARGLLREFASFYRYTLEAGDQLIEFERELDYVHSYLEFERARFGNRIKVTEDIVASARGVYVPAFIVQPLVENSIQHGMRASGVLHIRLEAQYAGRWLTISVHDDGVGIPRADLGRVFDTDFGQGLGIALKNVDDRLKGHFGGGSGLSVESTEGKGTTVAARILLNRETACPGG